MNRLVAVLALVSACFVALLAGGSAGAAPAGFVTRSGTQLELDGQPYRFSGINIYNANNATGCWYAMASGSTLEGSFSAISASGGPKVIRAWFFQGLVTTGGLRDWSGFDHTLSVAASRGVKVIVTLENQWRDCNGAEGGAGIFKDKTWYETGYKEVDPGLTASYRDFVAEIVARYKDDPAILAWQLINEAEAADSYTVDANNNLVVGPCSPDAGSVLKSFAEDVSGLVKSIDPNHLISLGTIGSGQCGAGSAAEYRDLHSISTIDLCEFHDYGSPTTPMPGDEYNGLQNRIDQCNTLGKPLFVGETGILLNEVGGSVQQRADAFAAKFAAQFEAGIVGVLAWAWNRDGSVGDHDIGPGDPTLGVIDAYRNGLPTASGANGRIAYSDPYSGDLHTVNPDGSGVSVIPAAPGGDMSTTWSPDGTRIAFDNTGYIFTMNANGSNLVSFANDTSLGYPRLRGPNGVFDAARSATWSPNGTQLAFSGCLPAPKFCSIYVMSSSGPPDPNAITQVTPDGIGSGGFISWSPDGSKIVFDADAGSRTIGSATSYDLSIFTVDVQSHQITRITDAGGAPASAFVIDQHPDWSPDGSLIAFDRRYNIAQPSGGTLPSLPELWVASADGSVTRQVTTDQTVQRNSPQWSPDCTKLVYERYTPTGLDIGTVNPDGTGESLVTTDGPAHYEVQPSWQPLSGGGSVVCAPIPPPSAPAAPSAVVASAGNGSASVSWAAPENGGSPITSYTVTPSSGTPVTVDGGLSTATLGGLSNGTSYTFTVTATNAAGTSGPSPSSHAVTPDAGNTVTPLTAAGDVAAGGSVYAGDGSSSSSPVYIAVTSPTAGTIAFATSTPTASAPSGFQFVGQQIDIQAPLASVEVPLTLTFVVDSSQLGGADPSSVEVFRDGAPIAPCADSSGQANPDPCVSFRQAGANGVQLGVLSSHASRWNFGVAKPTDQTAPTTTVDLNPSTPDGQNSWYVSNVKVRVAAIDDAGGSGVAVTRCVLDPAIPPTTFADIPAGCAYTGAGADVTSGGMHTIYAVSKDAADNVENPVVSASFKIDKTKPSLAPSVSPTPLYLNGSGTASPGASDVAGSGVASSSCGAVNTSTAGLHTVTCTATDNAGNTNSQGFDYTVGYRFGGFISPVPKSTVNSGSTLPVKFQLQNASGQPISNTAAQSLVSPSCKIQIILVKPAGAVSGCPTYSAKEKLFQFNLKTTNAMKGANGVSINVTIGTTIVTTSTIAPFTVN